MHPEIFPYSVVHQDGPRLGGEQTCFESYFLSWMPALLVTSLISGSLGLLSVIGLTIWIRQHGRHSLNHLRKPGPNGSKPLLVGFFHPYCNAGGGGERVLWVAIRALYKRNPDAKAVIYTGDIDASAEDILLRARQRFNIILPRPVHFVFLHRRAWVEASPYPYFTLLCQSLGSLVLAWEAMLKFVPDIYIDSMGYAFTLPLFRYLAGSHVACYVHYPTISTDMLTRVAERTATYNNARFISRSQVLSTFKIIYYRIFAYIYGMAGRCSQVVMVNSTWTWNHIVELWCCSQRTHIVYPPCDTREFLSLPLTDKSKNKIHSIVSVAQFRPEKDHRLQLRSFRTFLKRRPQEAAKYRLVLVGGCRNEGDAKRVEELRNLSKELSIFDQVDFRLNVSFSELKDLMATATVGLHTMWNEHFGIGVVELMAAGTLTLAHNSGGPRLDIVTEHDGMPTGFLADTELAYAEALDAIFLLSPKECMAIRTNARASVQRFSEETFEKDFLDAISILLH